MLQELKDVRQVDGEPRRRWFSDDFFDLIVWLDEQDAPLGFQLTYQKGHDEHSLTWRRDRGYEHNRVDDGEEAPGRHKSSPILVADGVFDHQGIARRFLEASGTIDPAIATLVHEKLLHVPQAREEP